MPASRVSSGPCSTTHTGDPFLKISGATRWLGQVSSMACLQAGEEPWLDSLDGARTTLGLTATGRRTHFLLFRQSDTLVPPGPLQSIPSEGQQASTWAAPTHCTQRRSLRTPELLINRELDTLHCFRQTPYTVRVGEKSHGHPQGTAASLAGVPSGRGAHHCPVMAWASQGRSSAWSCRSLESRKRVLGCAASSSGAAGQEGGGLQESIPKPAQGSDIPPPKCLVSWREEPGGLHHPLYLVLPLFPARPLTSEARLRPWEPTVRNFFGASTATTPPPSPK